MKELGEIFVGFIVVFFIIIFAVIIFNTELVGIDNMTTGKVIEIDDDTMVTCQLTEKSKSILKLKEELKAKKGK